MLVDKPKSSTTFPFNSGRITKWTKPYTSNPYEKVYDAAYDKSDRLASWIESIPGSGIQSRWDWRFDSAGNRLSEQFENLVSDYVARHQYTVNDADQLLNAESGGPLHVSGSLNEQGKINTGLSNAPVLTEADGSFSAWIQTNLPGSASFTVEDFNNNSTSQNVTVTPQALPEYDFEYDANGNTTRMVKTEPDGVTTSEVTYEWDARDQLVAINMGSHRSEFTYDGMGRRVRIKEIENAVVESDRFFLWNGLKIIASGPYSTPGITGADKLYFDDGFKLGSNYPYHYMKDHLGSVVAISQSKDGLSGLYEYDAYGNVDETNIAGAEPDFLYTGHYYHRPSGLYLAPYRAYDPKFGRWLSKDPIGHAGGMNLYEYVSGNVLNAVDPLGLKSYLIILPLYKPWNRRDAFIKDIAVEDIPHDELICVDGLEQLKKALSLPQAGDDVYIVGHGNPRGIGGWLPPFGKDHVTWLPSQFDQPNLKGTNVTLYTCQTGTDPEVVKQFSESFNGACVRAFKCNISWTTSRWPFEAGSFAPSIPSTKYPKAM